MKEKILSTFGSNPALKSVLEKVFSAKKPKDIFVNINEGIGLARAYLLKSLDILYNRLKLLRGSPDFQLMSEARRKIDVLNYDLANIQIPDFPQKITDEIRVNVGLFVGVLVKHAERINLLSLDQTSVPKMILNEEDRIREIMNTISLLPFEQPSEYLMKMKKITSLPDDLELPAGKNIESNIRDILSSTPGEVIAVEDLISRLGKRGFSVNEKKLIEIVKSLGGNVISLSKEGPIIVTGNKAVRDADQQKVLKLAVASEFLTIKKVISTLDWDELRARVTLRELDEKGIAVVSHSYAEGDKWYFPTLK
ncbi:MAG: hypothetical protein QXL15_00685 [Candidatus Korarchaeota archaeon]